MLLQPTPNGSSDRTYCPGSTSTSALLENKSRDINFISSPNAVESQEFDDDYCLYADDGLVFSSLYLYNMLWIRYSEIKNSYTYGNSSGNSSLISISKLQETPEHNDLLKQIRIRLCSCQMIQFLLELNKNYEAEMFIEQPHSCADSNSTWLMCKKLCVDEWMVSFASIRNNDTMTQIVSTMARLQFESALSVDLFVSKWMAMQLKSYVNKNSPNLLCLYQYTYNGDVIRIHKCPSHSKHPAESDLFESVSQLLDVMDSNYNDIAIQYPLYDCPLCPRSIVTISTTLRKKIKVCEIPQPTDIIRKVLLLKKHEVSYLMGFQGSRISDIRKASACTIKVLPYSTTMDTTFIPLKNTPQDLVICGTLANVQCTINLIQTYLMDYRNNNMCI